MTRIAIVADSHFDEHSRFDECVSIHQWMADDFDRRQVDLVLHAGDVFERKSTPKERFAFADWLQQVARHRPIVIVRGNHDALGDLPIFERLATEHPVIVEEAAAVHVVAGVAVGCLAWPRKAELLARLPSAIGREASESMARDALRMVLCGLGDEMSKHEGPRVLLSHAMVSGSQTSTGQPLVGCDLEVGLDDLKAAEADFYALGHIHMPQDWPGPVAYPGSPRRTSFGEVEDKGYILLEVSQEGQVSWERIQTPAIKMVLLEGELSEEGFVLEGGRLIAAEDVAGCEIRLRYTVPADRRDEGRGIARSLREAWTDAGALEVKLEEVVLATTRARAPEIVEARTIGEKLKTVWLARHDTPAPERAERLIHLANALEEEVRHEA